jgi:hypothetical protein
MKTYRFRVVYTAMPPDAPVVNVNTDPRYTIEVDVPESRMKCTSLADLRGEFICERVDEDAKARGLKWHAVWEMDLVGEPAGGEAGDA